MTAKELIIAIELAIKSYNIENDVMVTEIDLDPYHIIGTNETRYGIKIKFEKI